MKHFKKIEILPLTDFAQLNIQIANEKHYDLTKLGLDKEQTTNLLTEIYTIVSKVPGAIIGSQVGDKTFVNTQVKTAKDRKKLFTFPDRN